MLFVKRDKDTDNGGKTGQLTADPREADAIVKRAWNKIYEGNVKDQTARIGHFFNKYATRLFSATEYIIE